MGEGTLVDELFDDAGRLLAALSPTTLETGAWIWAFDSDISRWLLLIGLQKDQSKREAYGSVQKAIKDLDLGLALDQVFMVADDDPGLTHVRNASLRSVGGPLRDTGTFSVAGRQVTDPRPVRRDPLIYEQQVLASLSRHVGTRADLKINHPWHTDGLLGPDASIEAATYTIAIEIMSTTTVLSMQDLVSALGQFALFQRKLEARPRLSLLIVSASEISRRVVEETAGMLDVRVVQWQSDADDQVLQMALESLREPHSMTS